MKNPNLYSVHKCIVFLFVFILFINISSDVNAQIDAFNPCILGETELDEMGIFGIWKGSASLMSNRYTYSGQSFEFRLRQDNTRILGEGATFNEFRGGLGRFDIEGSFNGGLLRASSRNFNLVTVYKGPYENDIFNRYKQFEFKLNLVKDARLSQSYLVENEIHALPYQVDVLKGTFNSPDGIFVDAKDGENYLSRTPETIIVMFGGCQDGENRSLIDGVYREYLKEELKPNLKYGQYAKYFAYNRIKEAKLFIYKLLKVSPQAKIAIVGHSLGGDATFRLAQKLAEELPELKIDLVITLDPVTLKVNLPKPGPGKPRPPDNSRASIPLRPSNVTNWINVHVGTWTNKENFFVRTGGIQWKEQPNATNIIANTVHADANYMFFKAKDAQLGSMSPADKLLQLEGSSNRISFQKMLIKLNLLSPIP